MKKFVQKLILLIAAVTVFFTGAGVTIMNYCCNSCSEQTFFITEQHTCCTQENENSKLTENCCSTHQGRMDDKSCDDFTFTKDIHCTASRISIDIDASSFRPHISIPFVWISNVLPNIPLGILSENIVYTDDYTTFKSPPNISPREYLSLIRILII